MYRHTSRQIDGWLKKYGFDYLRSLAFTVYLSFRKKVIDIYDNM